MKKLKEFIKKYCALLIMVGMGVFILSKLILQIFKGISDFLINEAKDILRNFLLGYYSESIIEWNNISSYKWIDAVVFYLKVCFVVTIIFFVGAIIVATLIVVVEGCLKKLKDKILGKRNEKSLEYSRFQLWFIKCSADISFFINELRDDFLTGKYSEDQSSAMVNIIRRFTIEKLIDIVKRCLKFFFKFSITHVFIGILTIHIYFGKSILKIFEQFKILIIENPLCVSQIIDGFEFFTIICLLSYIVLDVRHKASGYSELRTERFKKLIQMEEKLLDILRNVRCLLEDNIETISECKLSILQTGGSELSGKECFICQNNVEFEKRSWGSYLPSDDRDYVLNQLNEMKEEFQKLFELEEEFKNSPFSYLNVYFVDSQAMLTRMPQFCIMGLENTEYKKMEFFCCSSMKIWFKNRFIKPTMSNEKKIFMPESYVRESILEASFMLDFELMRAFELELYLKQYEKKLFKRIKRIYKFSRFNLN